MKAIDAVLGQPWAIEPEWLSFIAAVAERQFDAPAVAAMKNNPPRAEQTPMVDGVAVINILGPIFPRANLIMESSGVTSVAALQTQFRAALADPNINAILLNIDSPGGAVTGIADFASEIRAGRKQKPVAAFVGGIGASAAYWIASAASSIAIASTASVGSIGVVAGMTKQVAPDSNGEMTFEIVSTNAPNKRVDPADSAGRSNIVARIDAIETVFIDAVAANRGVSAETVKADFGKGGVLMGAAAIAAGMADRVGTFDAVLAKLVAASSVNRSPSRAAATAYQEQPSMKTHESIAELTAAYPDLVAGIRKEAAAHATKAAADEAFKAGAKAERERLAGIEAAALPGHEKLIFDCKADPDCTPGDAALRVNAAERAKLSAAHAALSSGVEAQTSKVKAASTAQVSDAPKTFPQTAEGWKAEWAASAVLQGEFASADRYANYMRGVADGRIRRLSRS